jgi:hypothetical protein
MHLLKRFLFWMRTSVGQTDLLIKAEHDTHCARDLGISVSRIRLPSGAEVVLIEESREPEPEGRTDQPCVEANTFIHGKTGP